MAVRLLVGVVALLCGFLAVPAQATFPERPITLVVAYNRGGTTDLTARMLAPFIERHLGRGARVEVVNRVGLGGEIGFAVIADAEPDGHTIGFINTPNLVAIPIERQARYTLDRIDPLVNVVDDPAVWTVHANGPFASIADLVAEARRRPGALSAGATGGLGSDDHLAVIAMQRLAGIKLTLIPFTGGGAAHQAMLANRLTIVGENLGEGLRARETEPVRLLGVMSATRSPDAPDVPTFREQGFDVVLGALRGIAAPAGLLPEVRAKLVDAILKASRDPDFMRAAAEPQTFQPLRVIGPDAYAAELNAMNAAFTTLWKEQPWTAQ